MSAKKSRPAGVQSGQPAAELPGGSAEQPTDIRTRAGCSETYGSVAGAAVLMLWLWITAFIVLLGAEINAESEEQAGRDTTVGPEQPLGQRRAVKADSRPPAKAARRNGSGGTSRQKLAKR